MKIFMKKNNKFNLYLIKNNFYYLLDAFKKLKNKKELNLFNLNLKILNL